MNFLKNAALVAGMLTAIATPALHAQSQIIEVMTIDNTAMVVDGLLITTLKANYSGTAKVNIPSPLPQEKEENALNELLGGGGSNTIAVVVGNPSAELSLQYTFIGVSPKVEGTSNNFEEVQFTFTDMSIKMVPTPKNPTSTGSGCKTYDQSACSSN